jgi:predicted nuclease with TOPRIM domain
MNRKEIIKKLIRQIRDIREEYADLEFKYDKNLCEFEILQDNFKEDTARLEELQDKHDDLVYDHRILEDKLSDLEIELDDTKHDRDHYEDLAREHLSEHFI